MRNQVKNSEKQINQNKEQIKMKLTWKFYSNKTSISFSLSSLSSSDNKSLSSNDNKFKLLKRLQNLYNNLIEDYLGSFPSNKMIIKLDLQQLLNSTCQRTTHTNQFYFSSLFVCDPFKYQGGVLCRKTTALFNQNDAN